MATFEPIIGGGFDQLAAQRQYWGGQNLATQSANVERAVRANDAVNRWLEQASQNRQQAIDRDFAAQLGAQRDVQQQQNFLTSMAASKEEWQQRLKEERHRTDQTFKWHDEAIKAKDQAERDALNTVSNMGQALAPDADKYGKAFDDAQETLNKATRDLATKHIELQKQGAGKIVYDPRTKLYKIDPSLTSRKDRFEAQKAVDAANDAFAQVQSDYNAATIQFQTTGQQFEDFKNRTLGPNGLVITKRGDKYAIYSPRHNQTWGAGQAATISPPSTEGKKWKWDAKTGTMIPDTEGTGTTPPTVTQPVPIPAPTSAPVTNAVPPTTPAYQTTTGTERRMPRPIIPSTTPPQMDYSRVTGTGRRRIVRPLSVTPSILPPPPVAPTPTNAPPAAAPVAPGPIINWRGAQPQDVVLPTTTSQPTIAAAAAQAPGAPQISKRQMTAINRGYSLPVLQQRELSRLGSMKDDDLLDLANKLGFDLKSVGLSTFITTSLPQKSYSRKELEQAIEGHAQLNDVAL